MSVRDQALAWAAADPDPATAAEVRALVEKGNDAELADRFGARLEFGTAGLRGVLGGGPNRMNRAVVRRTTAGLARYLKAKVPGAAQKGVVVGRDGRKLSKEFAADTAAVLAAEGLKAHVFEDLAPTPLTAYAVNALGAAGAVMVTASHNPPEYNGYKVYWGNGAQIIPPHDGGIAAAIDAVGPANEVKLLDEKEARAKGLWLDVAAKVERDYFDAILALRPNKKPGDLSIVYSAMHGVGGRFVAQALKEAGFTRFHPVAEQQEPDGNFPTVRFPNPEEKGAMDLSTALAERVKADVVLANDPDADRLAVMARDADGKLTMLSGNEVGVLLGHYLLTQQQTKKPLVITTIVSSAQLRAIAEALGAAYDETLTGFKWIANRALEREPVEGVTFVFGYEEALGYTVGTVARDKDGVGAALVAADMAAWCKQRGKTLYGYLEEVQRAHGLFVARQANFTLPGAAGQALIGKVMAAFRERSIDSAAGLKVLASNDYQKHPRLPSSNVLSWELEGGSRITARPSGTEPKIKFYFELKEKMKTGEPIRDARARAMKNLDALEHDFLAQAYARGLPEGKN